MERIYLSESEIKKELLQMLVAADDFFQNNGIKYSIFAGTLLGAVRHNGFIPWDDDIDLCMLRDDYNRLIQILRHDNKIGNGLVVKGYELGSSKLPFLKIENPEFCVQERAIDEDVDYCNLWIDIFPIDGVPSKCKKLYCDFLFRFVKRIWTYKWFQVNNWHVTRTKFKLFYTTLIKFVLIPFSFDAISKTFINVCTLFSKDNTEYVCNNVWGMGYREVFPKCLMDKTVEYMFDGITVQGIEDADKWLTIRYGNYMTLPPVEQRNNHGMTVWRNNE